MTGSVSIKGSREMMTPHACTPGCRTDPSNRAARSIRRWTTGSFDPKAASRSGEALRALANVILGVSGTSEASLFVSASG